MTRTYVRSRRQQFCRIANEECAFFILLSKLRFDFGSSSRIVDGICNIIDTGGLMTAGIALIPEKTGAHRAPLQCSIQFFRILLKLEVHEKVLESDGSLLPQLPAGANGVSGEFLVVDCNKPDVAGVACPRNRHLLLPSSHARRLVV